MPDKKTILITGATGQQGGATARELAGQGFHLRAMTRKPDSDAAIKLRQDTGADIIAGDLDNAESLRNALKGAWGVFAVQNTWEAGVEKEEEQGLRIADLAREAGVAHFVYASVGSAHRKTGIPHFENKARVEQRVRDLAFPSHVIVRPVFFMENLISPWFLNGDTIYTALKPTTSLQMISVPDIGKYHALAFTDAERLNGREIDIAADPATMPEVAEAFSNALERTINFVEIPISEIRKNSEDFALMLEWFDAVGYDADIEGNQKEYGIEPTSLSEWAAVQRESGSLSVTAAAG